MMAAANRLAVSAFAVIYIYLLLPTAFCQDMYALDNPATCGQRLTVDSDGVVLTARSSEIAIVNPPTACIVQLVEDTMNVNGSARLQITVKQLQIENCAVNISVLNGVGASAGVLRQLGCTSSGTDIIYTTGSEATVAFYRPLTVSQNDYSVTLSVTTYVDLGTGRGTTVDGETDDGNGSATTIRACSSIVVAVAVSILAILY